jgi:hypothetical protein
MRQILIQTTFTIRSSYKVRWFFLQLFWWILFDVYADCLNKMWSLRDWSDAGLQL